MAENNMLAPYEKQFDVATRKEMVAEMIGKLRTSKGLQQKEVAEILGISPQTYNGYEKGRNEPPIEMLVRLSFLYDVPIDIMVQKDRMHVLGDSAMETVIMMEQQIAALREEFTNNPMAENEQLKSLITTMQLLADTNKQVIEKLKL